LAGRFFNIRLAYLGAATGAGLGMSGQAGAAVHTRTDQEQIISKKQGLQ